MAEGSAVSTAPSITVVTPTLGRAPEVRDLLTNLAAQTLPPAELILVDASPDRDTEAVVQGAPDGLPFSCRYLRRGGGTAIQRNEGLDIVCAAGNADLVATIDDDIRLEPDFFERMVEAFAGDAPNPAETRPIGGITGYITNHFLDPETSPRWRWFRRLKLFTTYEPGRYDFQTGYPINRYLQPPHETLREIDFMGAGCAIWRRQVFDGGLRFGAFFTGFGILEDAHLALRAGRSWRLLEHGRARCHHLRSTKSRENTWEVARKSAVNYRYVFVDLVPERTLRQELRFWRVQAFDLFRFTVAALRRPGRDTARTVAGKVVGIGQALRLEQPPAAEETHA